MSNYKVGDTIAPVELPLYWDKTSISSFISIGKGRKIKKIEGEFLQLEGDSTAWIKLSDLPPKYKIGDIVTDDNGKNLYRIDKIENGMYYSLDGGNFNSCLATDSMRHATEEELKKMEREIVGYEMKPEFRSPEYFNECAQAVGYIQFGNGNVVENMKEFGKNSIAAIQLDKKGILDKYFIPIYKNMEKKIIGYKLIKPEYEDAAKAIINSKHPYQGNWWNNNARENLVKYGYNFTEGQSESVAGFVREAGVLDLWFEPVYEPKETKFKFGDKQIEVTFGKGYIKAQGKTITRDQLSGLLNMMEGTTFDPIEGWTVSFPKVKIGCCTFDAGEIDTMIGDYDELNS